MVEVAEFEAYKEKYRGIISSQLSRMGCRPVLFIGSGVTRRYMDGPSWSELLLQISKLIGLDVEQFNYISQMNDGNPIKIGDELSSRVLSWAYEKGKNSFPAEYFDPSCDKDIFIKHLACQILAGLDTSSVKDSDLIAELDSFKGISPHAVVTTNFDNFIESAYDGYEVVVGEKIIKFSLSIIAEIYKIHGCVSDPRTLVLTSSDYERFIKKRKYISAKMMMYFAEYPVFIFGYSMNDDNINSILSDLGEALGSDGGLLENVFLVKRVRDLSSLDALQEEHAVTPAAGSANSIRVRTISTPDFKWVYDVLGDVDNPIRVSAGAMRSFASKMVDIVSSDIPARRLVVDMKRMDALSQDSEEILNVLGLARVVNLEADYPYLTSELAGELGYAHWANKNMKQLVKAVEEKLGFKVKDTQNDYHAPMRTSKRGNSVPRFSQKYVDLMKDTKADLGL